MVSEVYKNNHVFKNIWVKIEKCRYGSYLRESTKYICKNYINPPPPKSLLILTLECPMTDLRRGRMQHWHSKRMIGK